MQDVHPIGTTPTGGFADRRLRPHSHHHQGALKCPRCESLNTKFCYYNNYNLSQPRHFCKNCRRYWTKGGVLRNVPVGGGCRKSKRSSKSKPKQQQQLSLSPTSTLVAGKTTTNNNTLSSLSSSEGSTSGTQFGGSTFPIPDSENFEVPVLGSGNNDNNSNNNNIASMNYHHNISDMYDISGFGNNFMGTNSSPASTEDMNIPLETTSFSEFIQGGQQMLDDSNWELKDSCGAQGMLDHETVRIEDLLQNRESSGGLNNVLDWHGHEHGLFDLPHVDDHHQLEAAFWSQNTSSHHQHQWSDNNGSHHSLFLP